MSEAKDYIIRVWDTFYQTWIYENSAPCLTWYTRDAAIKVAKDFTKIVDSDTEEVQVHVRTPAAGCTQMIGFVLPNGEFEECFC